MLGLLEQFRRDFAADGDMCSHKAEHLDIKFFDLRKGRASGRQHVCLASLGQFRNLGIHRAISRTPRICCIAT